jgi:rod shape-determining protein MreC
MRDSLRNRPIKISRASPYRSLTLIVAMLVLALLLLVLDQAGMLGQLRAQAQTLLSPALQVLRRAGDSVSGIGQGLSDVQQLRAQVDALQQENSQLKAQNLRVQELELENARLREQVRLEQEHPWKLLGAELTATTPDAGRRVVFLAAGSDQGVKPGMAVIGREGSSPPTLIGVIETVGPRSASVLLITDYSSVISVQVYRSGGVTRGIVQGQWQRGSRLKLREVDRAEPLAVGDIVKTAGLTADLDLDLPRAAIVKDIPIGTVETIETDGHSQVAELRPFVDPDRISYAWVLLNQDE